MNRRHFMKASLAAAGPFLISPALTLAAGTNLKKRPPNIILIVADDQGFADLSCAGLVNDVKTPNLDKLAVKGIRFTQAYATAPICNPSRAGLMTGCYQQRFGNFWYNGKGIQDLRFALIPELLKENGYVNGYVGKCHYGKSDGSEGRGFPLNHGFDYFYGFFGGRKHYLKHNAAAERQFWKVWSQYKRSGQGLGMPPMWINRQPKDQEGFSTELFGQQARSFIRDNRDKPFYLHLAFNAVHNYTHQLPKEYLDNQNLKGYHDWDPSKEDYKQWYKDGRKPNNPEGRALYLGQLSYLDREVGKILGYLNEQGLEKNTVVIYISDNGGSVPIYADNTPLRGGKYTLYEGGIRVPLIISWPGQFEQDKVINNVVSAMDIFPTLCRLTGIEIPADIDGMDITELLYGRNHKLCHKTLIWDTERETAVRHGDWKLKTAESRKHAVEQQVELELGEFLYNLGNDPGEQVDVSQEHPQVVKELKSIYAAWRKSLNQ